jgi:hypothetical protein
MALGKIYVTTTDNIGIYKIGRTKDTQKRLQQMQTYIVSDVKIIYEYETDNNVLMESMIHYLLKKYRVSNREHFKCSSELINNVILQTINKSISIESYVDNPDNFISKHIIISNDNVHCKTIWDSYKDWCIDNDTKPIKQSQLESIIQKRFSLGDIKKVTVYEKRSRGWKNISLIV